MDSTFTVLADGGAEAIDMLRGGFALAQRVLSFPRPVIAACTGHAVAMGAFLLLSADHRVGVERAVQDRRQRGRDRADDAAFGAGDPALATLSPGVRPSGAVERDVRSASAVTAGFLDRVVDAGDVLSAAHETATQAAALDAAAYAATKRGPGRAC